MDYYRGKQNINTNTKSLQQIFYGAPGTGKSFATKNVVDMYSTTIRTTFHPDSDYSTFVGAYKPVKVSRTVYGLNQDKTVPLKGSDGKELKEDYITYKFVPQAFLKAYVNAWKTFAEKEIGEEAKPQFLVIEEINRGNCAQIFGDLFQLLDRKNGYSEYPIIADDDIRKALLDNDPDNEYKFGENGLVLDEGIKVEINENYDKPIADQICKGEILVLPPNLHIWATMNTSDQSLFPIDSAFKRRWDWKYVKIKNAGKGWKIDVKSNDGEHVDWWAFLQKINAIISNVTTSADKQLGYFFCKPDLKSDETMEEPDLISKDTFVGKVVFYLWNDVLKDYALENNSFFKMDEVDAQGKSTSTDITFPDFYDDNGESVNEEVVKQFIGNVMKWGQQQNANN